jgi:micrococcal nuclease
VGDEVIAAPYTYRAEIVEVYDGDTVTARVDLGFRVSVMARVRLSRINAPEVRGVERERGLRSRDWLRERLIGGKVILRTEKDKQEKFGRWLGEIWDDEGECINDTLVLLGLANYAEY